MAISEGLISKVGAQRADEDELAAAGSSALHGACVENMPTENSAGDDANLDAMDPKANTTSL